MAVTRGATASSGIAGHEALRIGGVAMGTRMLRKATSPPIQPVPTQIAGRETTPRQGSGRSARLSRRALLGGAAGFGLALVGLGGLLTACAPSDRATPPLSTPTTDNVPTAVSTVAEGATSPAAPSPPIPASTPAVVLTATGLT